MRNKKLLTKKFREDVFGNDYYVVVGDATEANNWIKKHATECTLGIDNEYACAVYFSGEDRGVVIYFSAEAWNSKKFIHDTIAHEALHATIRSLMQHGVLLTDDNHEVFCYTLGWIVRNIYELRSK